MLQDILNNRSIGELYFMRNDFNKQRICNQLSQSRGIIGKYNKYARRSEYNIVILNGFYGYGYKVSVRIVISV